MGGVLRHRRGMTRRERGCYDVGGMTKGGIRCDEVVLLKIKFDILHFCKFG